MSEEEKKYTLCGKPHFHTMSSASGHLRLDFSSTVEARQFAELVLQRVEERRRRKAKREEERITQLNQKAKASGKRGLGGLLSTMNENDANKDVKEKTVKPFFFSLPVC